VATRIDRKWHPRCVAACDGSYMSNLSDTSCSGAFILHCTSTKKEIRGCFTDSSSDSDNYRGEILGAIGATLLIDAALKTRSPANLPPYTPSITLYCNNRGVVIHGNAPSKPLKDGQAQADLLRLLKTYSRAIPANLNYGCTQKGTPTTIYPLNFSHSLNSST
jgi:hypothetical protein